MIIEVPSRFAPSCDGKRVEVLDGWRGLAISLVLLNHFFLPGWVSFGRLGVDIFFVLSGLLMSNILFVKQTPLKTFYKRRISRIFPVLFIFISLTYGLSFLFNLSSEHENYLYALLFLRSYVDHAPNIWNTGIPVGHLWSLNVEEHCYILLSLLTLFLNRSLLIKGAFLIFLGALSIIMNYVYIQMPDSETPYFWGARTEVIASHLLLSAGYFLVKRELGLRSNAVVFSVVLVLAVSCYLKSAPIHWSAKWSLSPLLLAYLVNHLSDAPRMLTQALKLRWVQSVGVWSYSIYLWQQPFYYYMTKYGNIFPYSNIVGLILAMIVGYLSFKYIENPIRESLNKRW
jgi:peptidoglycan/LPS O-acetylase OafA/YrhL